MNNLVTNKEDRLPNGGQMAGDKPAFLSRVWLVATLLQLPYTLLYLHYLRAHTHYQFFPILIAVVGYYFMSRRAKGTCRSSNWLTIMLGGIGCFLAVFATIVVSAWLGYLGLIFTLAAWFSTQVDRETNDRLTYLAWPLLIAWQPPYSDLATADTYLITYLQQLSADMSSQLLDVLGVIHVLVGNVIQLPDQSLSIEQGCSGVQSFFAIVCVSSLMMISFRRTWFHSVIIVLSSVFWTVVMNTIRITMIPIASNLLSVDLTHGTPHEILGFAAMGVATWMLLATDQIVAILLRNPPVGQTFPRVVPEERIANLVAGDVAGSMQRWLRNGFAWFAISILGFNSLIQINDIQKKTLRLFEGNLFLDLEESDLPERIATWEQLDYELIRRTNVADFGERSDIWEFGDSRVKVMVSLDQTFRMWHDLSICYRNAGWRIVDEKVLYGKNESWPFVVVDFDRPDGRMATLVYCLFDRSGLPLEVPGQLDVFSATWKRIERRFSFSSSELFREQTCFQVQLFLQTNSGDATRLDSLLELFEEGRERLREQGLASLER
jgi:exosortase